MSPLLFDIVMEGLSRMLDVVATTSQFSGFSVGNTAGNSEMVSHLLFANDTLIFCDVDPTQIASLRAILARFKEVSGLRINLGKSELVPIGVVHNMDVLVGMLGSRQSSLPLRYLGLPLGAKFKELSIWNPILEKMERRLARWKRLLLLKVLFPPYLHTFFPFCLYLGRWQIIWRSYKEIFCGVVLVGILNYT